METRLAVPSSWGQLLYNVEQLSQLFMKLATIPYPNLTFAGTPRLIPKSKRRIGNVPFKWLLSGWKPAWPLRAVERQRIQSSFANGTNNRLNRQSFSQYPYRASYRGLHNNQKACTRRHNLLAVGAIRAVGLGASRRPSIGSFAKLISLR
jgi:hypothetical protein